MSSIRRTLSHPLRYLCLLFYSYSISPSRRTQHEECNTSFRETIAPDWLHSLPPGLDLSLINKTGASPERFVDAIRYLKPFLPPGYKLLEQGDLKVVGKFPVDADGFADLRIGEWNGTLVMVKSFRCYTSSNGLLSYLKLYRELLIYSRLNDGNESFASLLGVYTTLEHPLCLVFEMIHHVNLREYLRDKNNQNFGRRKLLLDIARGLERIHNHGLIHGNLTTSDVFLDGNGRARITGLGTVHVPFSVKIGGIGPSSHQALAPELVEPWRWGLADSGPSTASDVFMFALVAWEIFGGKSDRSTIAQMHSMLRGDRPNRPCHPELSKRMWKVIRRCCQSNPAKRMTLSQIITTLEMDQ